MPREVQRWIAIAPFSSSRRSMSSSDVGPVLAEAATCLSNKPSQNLAGGASVPARQYSDGACFCNAGRWICLGG